MHRLRPWLLPRKTTRASGRWISTLEGYRAFHPKPLPPNLDWTPALAAALADASLLVGRLAGEGRRLPNPHLLIRPFVRREAVRSSRIEGTQATLGELLAAGAGAAVDRSPVWGGRRSSELCRDGARLPRARGVDGRIRRAS
ncbi:MAG: hypothetical protein KF791_07005 [Verrucomicrobiae bacterium]|nr:hypothetical protein [Verrucomicrobiae bacterium]